MLAAAGAIFTPRFDQGDIDREALKRGIFPYVLPGLFKGIS